MKRLTKDEFEECLKLTRLYAPQVLPVNWERLEMSWPVDHPLYGQIKYMSQNQLQVIFTADKLWGDGKTWMHVSMSRRFRLPSYEDMTEVKDIFIGKTRQALQIFSRADRHVNIHPYCLHLWCAVEGDGLPDFGKDGTI